MPMPIYFWSVDLLHLKIVSVITLPFGRKEAWITDWRCYQFLGGLDSSKPLSLCITSSNCANYRLRQVAATPVQGNTENACFIFGHTLTLSVSNENLVPQFDSDTNYHFLYWTALNWPRYLKLEHGFRNTPYTAREKFKWRVLTAPPPP